MGKKKFDFECIYYTNNVISRLDDVGYFTETMILAEKLRYIILHISQNNYDEHQSVDLSEAQLGGAVKHAHKDTYTATFDDMVKDGLISYTGIDANGEYIAELTEEGKKIANLGNEIPKKDNPSKPENGEKL